MICCNHVWLSFSHVLAVEEEALVDREVVDGAEDCVIEGVDVNSREGVRDKDVDKTADSKNLSVM